MIRMIKQKIRKINRLVLRVCNFCTKKDAKSIFFYPHGNCLYDGYDVLNGRSSNVLCLLNSILRDSKYDDYQLYVLYYHKDRLQLYLDYSKKFVPERIHFIYFQESRSVWNAVFKSRIIFTDTDYTRIYYRVQSQKVVCLNYFGGLIKSEFHRWTNYGGFERMLAEQKEMYRLYDYHLSISDICSKFIALDNCHYYPHFISLGFPRNDVFFEDNLTLRKEVESLVDFKVEHIITYVPTHRDYENPDREFFDPLKTAERSIWGRVEYEDLLKLEKVLDDSNTLIIAKVHPVQNARTSVISKESSKHIIFFTDLEKKIRTSLNPLLAISDSIITDYTTTVYDYLYLNRPIIYYFYDIEQYRATRGFFIEPIECICAGHLTYTLKELCAAIKCVANGADPYKTKREFLQELFIKNLDGCACERIKNFFLGEV